MGARSVSLGEAVSAAVNDATALYWNPAALAHLDSFSSAVLSHDNLPQGGTQETGFVGWKSGRGSAVGLGLAHAGVGSLERTDAWGAKAGDFSPRDLAASLGYAHHFKSLPGSPAGWSAGLAAKYIRSTLLDSAQTAALDVGVLVPGLFQDRLRLAFTSTNLGGRLKYQKEPEKLPQVQKLGAAWRPVPPWTVCLDIARPDDGPAFVAGGSEYRRPLGKKLALAGRAGYNARPAVHGDRTAGFSLGGGIDMGELRVDYSYSFSKNGWDSQGISLAWKLERKKTPSVRALLRDGRRLLSENRFPEAILKFQGALAVDPDNPWAQQGILTAYHQLSGQ